MYICTTNDENDTKFTSTKYTEQIKELIHHPLCKVCVVNRNTIDFSTKELTQRERNTIYQWYHIECCFNFLKHAQPDDIIIRIRPDIKFDCSIESFVSILKKPFDGLLIPQGNDIFSPDYKKNVTHTINDQIAIGHIEALKIYCSLFSAIDFSKETSPLVSEAILWNYLSTHRIPITRIDLPYTLCLSECKLIAITGDSGAGKTTLVNSMRKVFPYDSNLVLETDRYHKWERNDTSWKQITHLNPEANLLEKMQDDTYRLKFGEQIQHVDYDHSTGKFTELQTIESKNYVFLCGLHTLYKEEMRSHTNLKVYVDTEKQLKRFWKVQRDMKKRGYSFQQCDELFQKREVDFEKYIYPQKEYADLIIHYYTEKPIPSEFTVDTIARPVKLRLETAPWILNYIQTFLEPFCTEILVNPKTKTTVWFIKETVLTDAVIERIPSEYKDYIDTRNIDTSYLGLIQVCLLLILLEPKQTGSHHS